MSDDAYDQAGRQGLTAAQRNFGKTLPEEQQNDFEQMSKVEREAMMASLERPTTPNKDRESVGGSLEARVKSLEQGEHLRAGKDIDIQGTRIGVKGRTDRGGGQDAGGTIDAPTYAIGILVGGVADVIEVYYKP